LHTVINLATFPELPSNSCSLATFTYVLGCANAAALFAPPNPVWAIIACSAASYSCCCCTTYLRLMSCQLMMYGGGSDSVFDGDDDVGGRVGSGN